MSVGPKGGVLYSWPPLSSITRAEAACMGELLLLETHPVARSRRNFTNLEVELLTLYTFIFFVFSVCLFPGSPVLLFLINRVCRVQ